MAKTAFTRILAGLLPVLLTTILIIGVSGKDIGFGTPITISAKLFLDKEGHLRLSCREVLVVGVAVTNAPISATEDREKELKPLAAQGKTVTLHGQFHKINLHQEHEVGSLMYFVLDGALDVIPI